MTHYGKCRIDGDTTIHDELLYIGQTTCGEIEIPLKGRDIKAICTTGENDLAVESVADSPYVRMWMERYGDETIQHALAEYGCWTESELTKRLSNIHRLVWLLAWDVFDSEDPNEYLAADALQDSRLEDL
jgi:hypothetical protein